MLQSQWRFVQAVFCYIGPPSHLLWHIKLPLLFNMAIAALVMADYQLLFHRVAAFENMDAIVANAWPMISFVMALLLTIRLNRVYDRW